MKAKFGKMSPGNKAGGELNYTSTEKGLGGPIDGEPTSGLNSEKGVKGSNRLTLPNTKHEKMKFKKPRIK